MVTAARVRWELPRRRDRCRDRADVAFPKNKIARSRSHNRATPVQRERLTYLQVIHDRDTVDHRSLGGEWSLHAGRVPHLYERIIRRGDKIACAHAPNERYCQQERREQQNRGRGAERSACAPWTMHTPTTPPLCPVSILSHSHEPIRHTRMHRSSEPLISRSP